MTSGQKVSPGLRAGRIGVLVGAWCGLCLALTFVGSWFGWGVVAGDHLTARILAEAIQRRWGVDADFRALAATLLLVPVLAGALSGGVVEVIARLLRVDTQGHSIAAWRWTWAVARGWWPLLVLPLLALIVLEWLDMTWIAWFTVLLYLPLSFFVSDRILLAGDPARWRPRWRWPGMHALAALLVLLLLDWGVDFASGRAAGHLRAQSFPQAAWLGLPFLLAVLLVFGAWTSAASDGLWIDGSGERGAVRRILCKALDRGRIGAYVAMDFRIGAAVAAIAVPLLLCKVLGIYEWPQVAWDLRERGETLPVPLRFLQVLSREGVLPLLAVPLAVPGMLLYRRLWVGLDRDQPT
ncbi:hypothetical protein [Arenimonas terrae]|uniref:Uncharacterized protein n=1 Tax=Arenimonas terrae TaxID=2546226 RepID=A0A5C4RWT4_9GAMM|nr:hypothetical protein [Arenimonas terrae]TNJ35660.1 hypothetical protein E1B00_07905 [Arenimonas terrae]